MKKGWRSLWFLVGFLPLLIVLWLAWVLPGWQALWEMWPLMLLCILAGYALGVGYHWLYRLLDGEQPPAKEVTPEEIKLRELAESLRNNQQIQDVEIKNLRTLLQQARKESFGHMMKSGERGKQIIMLERKVESKQRELFNARAKMKRLAGKQRRKPVDHHSWPEYIDDM
jgi:hypothetical protein